MDVNNIYVFINGVSFCCLIIICSTLTEYVFDKFSQPGTPHWQDHRRARVVTPIATLVTTSMLAAIALMFRPPVPLFSDVVALCVILIAVAAGIWWFFCFVLNVNKQLVALKLEQQEQHEE
jgi:hypothetical protein